MSFPHASALPSRQLLRGFTLYRSVELGLGHSIDPFQGPFLDTDVLANDFGSDACVAQPQRQGVRKRKPSKSAFVCAALARFVDHRTSVHPFQRDESSNGLLENRDRPPLAHSLSSSSRPVRGHACRIQLSVMRREAGGEPCARVRRGPPRRSWTSPDRCGLRRYEPKA